MSIKPAAALPGGFAARARERGWPDGLLGRAVELRVPLSTIERWLTNEWSNAEHVERRLYWHERMTFGTLRGREATTADNEAYIDLFANAPEELGEWEIYTERGPYAFAQFRLQENVTVLVIEEEGRLIASCSFSMRNVYVGGRKLSVRYGQALRVRKDCRRQGYGDQVRSLAWPVGISRPSHTQYDIMRSTNFAVVSWWQKYNPSFFEGVPERGEGEVPGVPVTVLQYPVRPFHGDARGIRRAKPADVSRCAGLINRTHRGLDLFRPYTAEFLRDALDEHLWGEGHETWSFYPHVYGWDEYHVLEEAGRVVACAGLWDRGRDLRDRWRHAKTDDERVVSVTSVLDFGFEPGKEASMARLLGYLIGETARLGRDYLLAPLQHLPRLAAKLERYGPEPDTRSLRWGLRDPDVTRPYTDLRYW